MRNFDLSISNIFLPSSFSLLDSEILSIAPVQVANAEIMTDQAAPGQPVSVSGWGRLSETGGMPDRLHDVNIPVVSRQECNSAAAYGGRVTSTMLCAGLRNGGKDACQGDSGGPLLWLNENREWVQIGVTSFGEGCAEAEFPGVYTRVASFLDLDEQANDLSSVTVGRQYLGEMTEGASFSTIFFLPTLFSA